MSTENGSAPAGNPTPTPAASATPTPAATPTPTPAAPATPAIEWLKDADETTVGYVQNKGWKQPIDLLNGYRHLEKHVGLPADRVLAVPKGDDPAEWGQVYDKLGRPKDAKDYKIDIPADVGDPKYADAARAAFHKIGLNAKQAAELVAWNNQYSMDAVKARDDSYRATIEEETKALKTEWGAAHDQNINIAKHTARAFGLDAATIDKMESVTGFSKLMKFMHTVGTRLGEDKFVGAEGGASSFGVLTPGQAKAQLQELGMDKEWHTAWVNPNHPGHKAAVEKKARLTALAYPEQG